MKLFTARHIIMILMLRRSQEYRKRKLGSNMDKHKPVGRPRDIFIWQLFPPKLPLDDYTFRTMANEGAGRLYPTNLNTLIIQFLGLLH